MICKMNYDMKEKQIFFDFYYEIFDLRTHIELENSIDLLFSLNDLKDVKRIKYMFSCFEEKLNRILKLNNNEKINIEDIENAFFKSLEYQLYYIEDNEISLDKLKIEYFL